MARPVFEECFRVHRVNSTRTNGPAGRVFLIAGVHRTNAARTSRTILFFAGWRWRRFDSIRFEDWKGEEDWKRARIATEKDLATKMAALIFAIACSSPCFRSRRPTGRITLWGEGYGLPIENTLDTIHEQKEIYSISRDSCTIDR